jgi:3-oxosteroid 1-dehydrogenase
VDWDERFDVVCVGSGAAGLAAAVTAAVHGCSVVVAEKGSLLGGSTAAGQAELWVPANHLALEMGLEDSKEEAARYLDFLSVGLGDPQLRAAYIEESVSAVQFFNEKVDLTLRVITDRCDWHYPYAPGSAKDGRYLEVAPFDAGELGDLSELLLVSPHGMAHFTQQDHFDAAGDLGAFTEMIARHEANNEFCNGTGLIARLLKAADDAGVSLRAQHACTRLIKDETGIVGVEIATPDGIRRIATTAVVLATGGYDWNPDLVATYEQVSVIGSLVPETVTGDHIVMGAEVGAQIGARPPGFTPLIPGMHIPGSEADDGPVHHFAFAGKPHAIYVNSSGSRIGDEAFYPDIDAKLATVDGKAVCYPNRPMWFVFDQNFRDKYAVGGTILPGEPIPEGTAWQADTPRELGLQAGIDPEGLEATIARFNDFCTEGIDQDFGRGTNEWSRETFGDTRMPNPLLGALDKPPYYAVQVIRVGAGIPSAGLRINENAQVVSMRGEAIPGLYAAGSAAAQLDFIGYQSGISSGRALTYGYVAGRHASETLTRRADDTVASAG